MEKSCWIKTQDQTKIYIKKWISNHKPKAIIQLSHGMAEHIERYHDFATFLTEQGYHVYGNDHRGHGQTGLHQGLLGYFSEKDGFSKVIDDSHLITKKIKAEYPNIPIILFGHSMGSFLVRCYLQKYGDEIDGIILSGTGYFMPIQTIPAKLLASLLPPKKPSLLMNRLAFGTYNKNITQKKTDFDWLSRDERIVEQYNNDPLCGFVPTARFFVDLMSGINQMQKIVHNNRKDMPLLFLSGSEDPVGKFKKGVWKSIKLYQKAGFHNITSHFLEGARHEILNERNKGKVYHFINQWISEQLDLKTEL